VEIAVSKIDGTKASPITIDDAIFAKPFQEPLVHQVLTAYLAGSRSGSSSQKNRADVRGGGSKPWRQKGTGRARAGTIRSPIWRGGGRAFPATPRSYAQKVNRKMYRGAIRSILSELIRQDRLTVFEEIALDSPKTRVLVDLLAKLQVNGQILILISSYNHALVMAARNLRNVEVLESKSINPVRLVGSDAVLISAAALKNLESALQ
tara:strand:- start:760 stop:1380 length:621 start_codon:yes stop_codon:yes gene_type:complete